MLPVFTWGYLIVLVGKRNLEVRPMVINKGEIVRRILYLNPDARFVFRAGDDKVRIARHLFFPVALTQCFVYETIDGRGHSARYTSRRLMTTEKSQEHPRVELQLTPS